MIVLASWTGESADKLRQVLRMTNESFAAHLGVAVRTVAYWRAQPDVIPRPAMQQILDTALARAPEPARQLFQLTQTTSTVTPGVVPTIRCKPDDVDELTLWLAESGISNNAIEQAEATALRLAGRHTRIPAQALIQDVLDVHQRIQEMLRSGHPRLRQARSLIRNDGMALAHASVLLSDLGRDQQAIKYGRAAQLCL